MVYVPQTIGDVTGGNYLEIDETGRIFVHGSARNYDDVYVTATGIASNGAAGPTWKQFRNDGSASSDGALQLSGTYFDIPTSGGYAALAAAIDGTAGQFTIEMWVKPTRVVYEYLCTLGSNASLRLDNSGGLPALRYDFGSTYVITMPINVGAWNHVVAVVDKVAGEGYFYVNGTKKTSTLGTGTIAMDTSVLEFGHGSDPSGTAQYTLGEFTVYDLLMTDAQVAARYNSGAGTASLPSGVTDSDRVLYLDCEDGSGSTVTNSKGPDGAIVGTEDVDYAWTTGPIGTSGSFGVYLPTFEPDVAQHAGFTLPLSHAWDMGTDLEPHIHFSIDRAMAAGETIKFALEYTTAQPGAVFPATSTVTPLTYTATGDEVAYQHFEADFPDGIDMSAIVVDSPQLTGTLTRMTDDTFPGDVYFMNLGFHFYGSSLGY